MSDVKDAAQYSMRGGKGSPDDQNNTIVKLASESGFSCYKNEQNKWRIEPREDGKNWYLLESDERWLLVIEDVPQILFRPSGAIAFIQRWLQT
ncbi:MAG: hypothetical protein AAFP20_22410 [Cyanobacteria bacterium J06614_10]